MTIQTARADVTTLSYPAESVPAARRRAWDPHGYVGVDREKADLARVLLGWLAQATVREAVSATGYRMLIVDRGDGH